MTEQDLLSTSQFLAGLHHTFQSSIFDIPESTPLAARVAGAESSHPARWLCPEAPLVTTRAQASQEGDGGGDHSPRFFPRTGLFAVDTMDSFCLFEEMVIISDTTWA